VQLQAWIGVEGPVFDTSKPLTPGEEAPSPEEPQKRKQPSEPEKPKHPRPEEVPAPGEEPPRYGIFTRIAAFFGRKGSKEKIARYDEWNRGRVAY
jgi:hypothetical protein